MTEKVIKRSFGPLQKYLQDEIKYWIGDFNALRNFIKHFCGFELLRLIKA